MATMHPLCTYCMPCSAMSNSTGDWLSVLITQRRAYDTCYPDFCASQYLTADTDTVFVIEDPQSRQIGEVQPQTSQPLGNNLYFLLTSQLHPNPKHTVKLNYIANKSFMFLSVDEMEHLPKPANTAYVIINGNGDRT